MCNKRICFCSTDRISELPDAVRSYIISLLSTRDAVRTSLLSKQWRHIYSSVSKLCFSQKMKGKTIRKEGEFKKLVDHVLLGHDESSIDRFVLTVKVDDEILNTKHLNKWISFLVAHCVGEFDLTCMQGSKPLGNLPGCFFTCNTLHTLVMKGVQINLPSAKTIVCFPALERLTLVGSEFNNDFFSFTNCPRLQILFIKRCVLGTISISFPSLVYLSLIDTSPKPNINLCTPKIKYLKYFTNEPPNVSINFFRSLSHLNICIRQRCTISNLSLLGGFAGKIQKGLSNMRTLILDTFYIESLMMGRYLFDSPPAPCWNLKTLKITYSSESHGQGIKILLRDYPKLQHLYLTFQLRRCKFAITEATEEYWKSKEKSAGITLNCLETVHLHNFGGNGGELDLVKYLLNKATILQKMIVCSWRAIGVDEADKKNIEEEIMAFPRVSPGAVIFL